MNARNGIPVVKLVRTGYTFGVNKVKILMKLVYALAEGPLRSVMRVASWILGSRGFRSTDVACKSNRILLLNLDISALSETLRVYIQDTPGAATFLSIRKILRADLCHLLLFGQHNSSSHQVRFCY